MTRHEFGCFLIGASIGVFLTLGMLILNNDNNRANVIEKYKSGEIVCVELNNELIWGVQNETI